jgi:hypothetical protein
MRTTSKWTQQASWSLSLITAAMLSACGGGWTDTGLTVSQSNTTATTAESQESAGAPAAAAEPAPVAATEPAPAAAEAAPAAQAEPEATVVVAAAAPNPTPVAITEPGAANLRTAPGSVPPPPPTGPAGKGPEAACNKNDVGGWTVPIPSKADANVPLKSLEQPGSRLFYISAATGSDETGEVYFWNGTEIIDAAGKTANASGVAYGTDPMNPGAAVKSFKRWAYVSPRQGGEDFGVRGKGGYSLTKTRGGFPDWWMFKRGETFDLTQDLLSYEREVTPSATSVLASLTVSGGRSATERQIVGAYGDVCAARPRFIRPQQGFITRWENAGFPAFKNAAYLSLHFDGHDRSVKSASNTGLTMLYQGPQSTNLLFEDMWFDAATVNIGAKNGAQITFRRSLITDNFESDGQFTQGLYYLGSREGRLRIEESILMRNGFSHGDPKLAWPPTGAQVWDHFSRNMYIQGETSNMNSALIDSVSMLGGSGDQFRAGMRVERNFFYQGYVSMGAYGGYADAEGPTGTMTDNVLQRFQGTGTNSNIGQPGWGLGLSSGAYKTEVARNIVSGAQYAGAGSAFSLSPLSWVCYAHTFNYATRENLIHDNIFESPADSAVVVTADGVTGESTPGCSNWKPAGVKGNELTNNVLVTPSGKATAYVQVGAAVGVTTDDTKNVGNKLYATRTAAATALGWTDPNRTLKTHLQASGIAVNSGDGFIEYYNAAIQMRRGQWRTELTSKALNNHVRAGFNMAAIQ